MIGHILQFSCRFLYKFWEKFEFFVIFSKVAQNFGVLDIGD